MEELIKRLERVIQTGAPDKDGMHPISAEAVLEVVKGLSELGTNLAEVGTDCISREQAIKTVGWYSCHSGDELLFADNALRQLPPIQPEPQYKTDYGFMWLCPKCGLPVHSDYTKCVRCGHNREKGV